MGIPGHGSRLADFGRPSLFIAYAVCTCSFSCLACNQAMSSARRVFALHLSFFVFFFLKATFFLRRHLPPLYDSFFSRCKVPLTEDRRLVFPYLQQPLALCVVRLVIHHIYLPIV